jgi:PDZ domain
VLCLSVTSRNQIFALKSWQNMLGITPKNRIRITSILCFSFTIIFIVSCGAVVPTVLTITRSARDLGILINITEKIAILTSNSVDFSYQDLGKKLRDVEAKKPYSNDFIGGMEERYSELLTNHQKLDDSISKTQAEADNLFSLLKTNADGNSTPELKEKMLDDINIKRKIFRNKIEVVEAVSSKVEVSIKKYHDILTYFQNKIGTEKIDEFIKIVDGVIGEAQALNQDVQVALVEGREIIKNYEGTTPALSPTPTPQPTDTYFDYSPPPSPSSSLPSPKNNSNVSRPKIGAEVVSLTPEIRQRINNDPKTGTELDVDQGILVVKVLKDSPAAESGINAYDVIVRINGKDVTKDSELISDISQFQEGGQIILHIRRSGQILEAHVHPRIMN